MDKPTTPAPGEISKEKAITLAVSQGIPLSSIIPLGDINLMSMEEKEYFALIGPDDADIVLLDSNDENKRCVVTKSNIAQISHDIVQGKWQSSKTTGSPIAFRISSEKLGNGQHRLISVSQTRCFIVAWVVTGVTQEAIDAMDKGKARLLQDRCAFLPDKLANSLVTKVMAKWYLVQGEINPDSVRKIAKQRIYDDVAWRLFNAHRESILPIVELANGKLKEGGLKWWAAPILVALCQMFKVNSARTYAFIADIELPLPTGSISRLFREYVLTTSKGVADQEKYSITLRAAKAVLEGTTVEALKKLKKVSKLID